MRLNDCNPGFKNEIAAEPGGGGIRGCFACAACTARCPVGGHDREFDPRRLIRLALLGRREEVLASPLIWRCSACYSCSEVCPQNVRFTDVLVAIKNIAAREGHAPPSQAKLGGILCQHGRLLEVGEFENEKREDLGLPPVESRPQDFQELLGETPPGSGKEDS